MIDDDLSKFIIGGISHNISLIELNLSHNKLGPERYLQEINLKKIFNYYYFFL
jgi:hypothetical protein